MDLCAVKSHEIRQTNIGSKPLKHDKKPHILLDTQPHMTRHRAAAIKSSLNKDNNLEDDKIGKYKRSKHHNIIKGSSKGGSRWSTRKILVILLLCFALIAQIIFLYMIFGNKTNNNSNNLNNSNNHNIDNIKNNLNEMKNKFDKFIDKGAPLSDNLKGLMNGLPDDMKQKIFGNKAKINQLQNRLID